MAKQTFTFRDMKFPTSVRVPLEGGGFTTKPGPDATVVVEVTIDAAEIARLLGYRALRSKSGKSTAIGGLIKVQTTDLRSTR